MLIGLSSIFFLTLRKEKSILENDTLQEHEITLKNFFTEAGENNEIKLSGNTGKIQQIKSPSLYSEDNVQITIQEQTYKPKNITFNFNDQTWVIKNIKKENEPKLSLIYLELNHKHKHQTLHQLKLQGPFPIHSSHELHVIHASTVYGNLNLFKNPIFQNANQLPKKQTVNSNSKKPQQNNSNSKDIAFELHSNYAQLLASHTKARLKLQKLIFTYNIWSITAKSGTLKTKSNQLYLNQNVILKNIEKNKHWYFDFAILHLKTGIFESDDFIKEFVK